MAGKRESPKAPESKSKTSPLRPKTEKDEGLAGGRKWKKKYLGYLEAPKPRRPNVYTMMEKMASNAREKIAG